MFQRDFVALGQNHTRNFVARHKLGFIATSSLCLGIELVGVRVRVRARVRIPRQIRHSSDAAPTQLRRSSDAAPAQLRRSSDAAPAQLRRSSDAAPAQLRRNCHENFPPILLFLFCNNVAY